MIKLRSEIFSKVDFGYDLIYCSTSLINNVQLLNKIISTLHQTHHSPSFPFSNHPDVGLVCRLGDTEVRHSVPPFMLYPEEQIQPPGIQPLPILSGNKALSPGRCAFLMHCFWSFAPQTCFRDLHAAVKCVGTKISPGEHFFPPDPETYAGLDKWREGAVAIVLMSIILRFPTPISFQSISKLFPAGSCGLSVTMSLWILTASFASGCTCSFFFATKTVNHHPL